MDGVGVVELEVDVLDDERPDLVAEPIGIEMALQDGKSAPQAATAKSPQTDLKRQPRLDLVRQHFRNRFIEVRENLHGELGLDPALSDQVVERVREGAAQTVFCQPRHSK